MNESINTYVPIIYMKSEMEIKDIQKKLKKELDKERYLHTRGVMYTAASLAMAYGYDISKAMLAGLLHDCAKCISSERQISICEEHHLIISNVEKENPYLLHQKTGAILAEELYDVHDPEILHAISVHTTGQVDMNLLDKIIFISDYIEPRRDKAPHLLELRQEAFHDIDACMADILYDTLHHLNSKKGAIDPTTQQTYEYFRQYEKEQPWKQ